MLRLLWQRIEGACERQMAMKTKEKARLLVIASTVLGIILPCSIVVHVLNVRARNGINETREEAHRVLGHIQSICTAIRGELATGNLAPEELHRLSYVQVNAIAAAMYADPSYDHRVLLQDPFGDHVRIMHSSHKLYIYSLGPDGVDTGCVDMYDPTNGVTSGGDICAWIVCDPTVGADGDE